MDSVITDVNTNRHKAQNDSCLTCVSVGIERFCWDKLINGQCTAQLSLSVLKVDLAHPAQRSLSLQSTHHNNISTLCSAHAFIQIRHFTYWNSWTGCLTCGRREWGQYTIFSRLTRVEKTCVAPLVLVKKRHYSLPLLPLWYLFYYLFLFFFRVNSFNGGEGKPIQKETADRRRLYHFVYDDSGLNLSIKRNLAIY